MRKIALLAVLALMLSAGAANAWTQYLDGTALPGSPWTVDPNNGGATLVNDGGVSAIQVYSWGGYYEWYTQAGVGSVLTMGARFRVAATGDSGSEAVLQATANTKTSAPVALGIKQTSSTGPYPSPVWAVMDYENGAVLQVLGSALDDYGYHTAYLQSAANGAWKVSWDGMEYTGTTTSRVDYGGWAEFGSGTYQIRNRSTTFNIDWIGYGGVNDYVVPEPASLLALGSGLLGMAGLIRRKK